MRERSAGQAIDGYPSLLTYNLHMTSTPLAQGWEIKFRLACVERRGDAYQELFAQIMERRDPGFQRVRPWGNVGDRKNDGWSPARRMLFQCYAPASLNASELMAKLDADYAGAIDYWQEYFDTWIFVHDDIAGLAPQVAKKIVELATNTTEVDCAAWGHIELREEFASLHDQDRTAILGPALTPYDFMSVDASTLKPIVTALGYMTPNPLAAVTVVPPDKIKANQLHPAQEEFLKLGSARAPLVEQYLTNSFILPTHADEIAEAVTAKYKTLRAEQRPANEIFDLMLAWISGGGGDSTTVANSLAVLAYFFERCHIFEVPTGLTSDSAN